MLIYDSNSRITIADLKVFYLVLFLKRRFDN
jgi:hypothetical protein